MIGASISAHSLCTDPFAWIGRLRCFCLPYPCNEIYDYDYDYVFRWIETYFLHSAIWRLRTLGRSSNCSCRLSPYRLLGPVRTAFVRSLQWTDVHCSATCKACLDTFIYVCTKTICFILCVNINLCSEFTETLALTIEMDILDIPNAKMDGYGRITQFG